MVNEQHPVQLSKMSKEGHEVKCKYISSYANRTLTGNFFSNNLNLSSLLQVCSFVPFIPDINLMLCVYVCVREKERERKRERGRGGGGGGKRE